MVDIDGIHRPKISNIPLQIAPVIQKVMSVVPFILIRVRALKRRKLRSS